MAVSASVSDRLKRAAAMLAKEQQAQVSPKQGLLAPGFALGGEPPPLVAPVSPAAEPSRGIAKPSNLFELARKRLMSPAVKVNATPRISEKVEPTPSEGGANDFTVESVRGRFAAKPLPSGPSVLAALQARIAKRARPVEPESGPASLAPVPVPVPVVDSGEQTFAAPETEQPDPDSSLAQGEDRDWSDFGGDVGDEPESDEGSAPTDDVTDNVASEEVGQPVKSVEAATGDIAVAPPSRSPAPSTAPLTMAQRMALIRAQIKEDPNALNAAVARSSGFDDVPDSDDPSDRDGSDDGDDPDDFVAPVNQVEFTGVLNSVRVYNDWAIGSLWTEDREEVRLTGSALSGLTEGLEYKFSGQMRTSARHGEALDVTSYEPVISVDAQALQKYMVKSFKGVGPVKAEKFIAELQETAKQALINEALESGDESPVAPGKIKEVQHQALVVLRDKLLHTPWLIDLTALASKAKLEDGHDPQAAAKHVVLTRNLMLRLGAQKGFKESVAKSLATYLLGELQHEQDKANGTKGGNGDKDDAQSMLNGIDLIEASWTKLVTNPYKPIGKAPGYAFGSAEIVAKFVGIPKDAGMRLAALSEYAVEQLCNSKGHTYLNANDFVEAIKRADPTVSPKAALSFALREKVLIADVAENRLYTPKLFEAESSLATSLAKLLQPSAALTERSASDIKRKLKKDAEKINPAFKNGLDDLQLDAVASMLTAPTRLHVLTGGPGTGKTSIIECAVYLLKRKEFVFTAPTGKAAKVLAARVKSMGHSASTIHSLLKGGPEDGFQVNAENPLGCDVLVVDESTMNGVELADALLQAIKSDAHVIFLGDPGRRATKDEPGRAGQLPSISPGRFMLDLLELPGVNHVNLQKTYRNSGGILEVVNEVGNGDLSVANREAVHFNPLPSATVGFAAVKQQYLECVMRDGIENTLLVMPKRQGDKTVPDWNTTYANAVLRDVLNPRGAKLPGTTLALGDRILIRQNLKIEQPAKDAPLRVMGNLAMPGMPLPIGFDVSKLQTAREPEPAKPLLDFRKLAGDLDIEEGVVLSEKSGEELVNERVVNGDTGTIIAYSMDANNPRMGTPKYVRLALDDGREVEFPGEEMGCLDHAYALTVHSAQGSEYKNVIMAVTPGGAGFMNQNMLFTGFSRAKSELSIYGDARDLKKIAATEMPGRNTALVARTVRALATMANSDSEVDLEDECPTT